MRALRVAFRSLFRSPGFTFAALLTLGLGLGLNTALFSVANSVLFRPLPYQNPERLMLVESVQPKQPEVEGWSSRQDFEDLRERCPSFERLAAVSPVWNLIVMLNGAAYRAESLFVSPDLFAVLGVTPAMGRWLDKGQKNEVVLSHDFWVNQFGGRADILGRTLEAEGQPYTVVGVAPKGFRSLGLHLGRPIEEIELWLPLAANQLMPQQRMVRWLSIVGRLKGGVNQTSAEREVAAAGAALASAYPATNAGFEMRVRPLSSRVVAGVEPGLLACLALVGVVLLMACVDVAGLMLARAAGRDREAGIRVALGAGKGSLLALFAAEGLLLAAGGALLALLTAIALVPLIVERAPANLPRRGDIGVDGTALAFCVAAALIAAVPSAAAPVWRVFRRDPADWLRGARTVGGPGRGRLVSAQVALATVLVACSVLMGRSFLRVLAVDPGFRPEGLITLTAQLPPKYRAPEQRRMMYERIEAALRESGNASAVGAVSRLPLQGATLGTWLTIEGKPAPATDKREVEYRVATASYFSAMGIALREGRGFDGRDEANPSLAVVVNESLARRYFPGESAVGKRIKLGPRPEAQEWIEIVGVTGDVHHDGLDRSVRAEVYRPYWLNPLFAPIFVVRTTRQPEAVLGELPRLLKSVDPELPLYNASSMETLMERASAQRRFLPEILGSLSLLALLLAGVGVYGVLAQAVAQRTPEIGLRMALGAGRWEIARLVAGQGLRLAGLGLAAGLAGGVAAGYALRSLLFGISPADGWSLAWTVVLLAGCAAAACLLPAWRAARLDPQRALRAE
jgi:predicted permease